MPIQSGTGSTNQTMTVSAFKKLVGKSNTGNQKAFYEETVASSIQINTKRIFGDNIPQSVPNPTTAIAGDNLYTTYSSSVGGSEIVQIVEFDVVGFNSQYDGDADKSFGDVEYFGGDESQVSGEHGYYLRLNSDYNTSSSFGGTAPFSSSQVVYSATGSLQLVHPQFGPATSNGYFLELYTSKGGTRINDTDPIDWIVDYYNGTILVQDYDSSKIPTYAVAYIYVGKYADQKIIDASGSGGGNEIIVKEEGSNISTAAESFDFVGSGVTATNSGNDITVTIPGGIDYGRRAISANATASINDRIIGITSTDALEIKLLPAQSLSAGQYITIKKEVNSINQVTISTSGSQMIDGVGSIVLESPFSALNLYSDGISSYFIY